MVNEYLDKCIDYAIEHKLFEAGVTVTVSGETSRKLLYGFILNENDSVLVVVGNPEEPYVCRTVHFTRIKELEEVWKDV